MGRKIFGIITIIIVVAVIGSLLYLSNRGTREEIPSAEQNTTENITTGNNTSVDTQIKETEGINTIATLEDEVTQNTIWCGTFQLIWNDLKNDLAKQDILFNPQIEMVENLNKGTFSTRDLSERYYYKKLGKPTVNLKQEIENAIKDKFNETSNILEDFDWNNNENDSYFLYAMLKKEFQFEHKFEELENGKFAEAEDVKFFGINANNNNEELRDQVEVLYYNSKDDFAIKLDTRQDDEVILCKNPQGNTFNEIYTNILNQERNYHGEDDLQSGELLKIPNIKLAEKHEFTELENKPFTFSTGEQYYIEKALQTIEFTLDKTGGRVESEAGMMANKTSIIVEPREFSVDNTFAIFLIEEDRQNPYFAAKIDDITKFQ